MEQMKKLKADMPAIGKRSVTLAKAVQEWKQAGELSNLVVEEGESRTLSYQSESFKPYYREFIPESVDKIKDLIGVSDGVKTSIQFTQQQSAITVSPKLSAATKMVTSKLYSRVISPQILTSEDVSEDEKLEAMSMARMATKEYIYGNSTEVEHWKPLIDKYLALRHPRIFIPTFNDIIVHNGGTLNIAADTLTVNAKKIQLYGTGKIVCDGPTTFDCTSFQGNIPILATKTMEAAKVTK